MKRDFAVTSRCLFSFKRGAWGLVASGALLSAASIQAQVESLEPNPLEPASAGAARALEFGRGSSSDVHLGRAARGKARGVEENPAETMLREIDGTNYRQHTGHQALRGDAVRPAPRIGGPRQSPSRGGREPVDFSRGGDHRHGRYAPRGGSRQRAPAVRTKRQQWL